MSEQTSKRGLWTELKGEIQKQWAKLSDDELDRAKGNVTELTGLIQRKYGEAREQVSEKLNRLMSTFHSSGNKFGNGAANSQTSGPSDPVHVQDQTDEHLFDEEETPDSELDHPGYKQNSDIGRNRNNDVNTGPLQ